MIDILIHALVFYFKDLYMMYSFMDSHACMTISDSQSHCHMFCTCFGIGSSKGYQLDRATGFSVAKGLVSDSYELVSSWFP